jgi:hypothetical protein
LRVIAAPHSYHWMRGKRTENVEPCPSVLSTVTLPPARTRQTDISQWRTLSAQPTFTSFGDASGASRPGAAPLGLWGRRCGGLQLATGCAAARFRR